MPNYQDAFISDVVVTIDETPERTFDQMVDSLKSAGMQINDLCKDRCVIEGTVDSGKVRGIDDMPGVEYVRTVFTYVADYPPGDPPCASRAGSRWRPPGRSPPRNRQGRPGLPPLRAAEREG